MSRTVTVEGMTCGHCEQTVEQALRTVRGVTETTADREEEEASIDGDADVAVLLGAVENAGYRSHPRAGTAVPGSPPRVRP